MTTPKIYVPKSSGKERTTQFGPILTLNLHADSVVEFLQEHTNAQGYVKIDVSPRREPDKFGNTHSLSLNTWVPKGKTPVGVKEAGRRQHPVDDEDQSIPF